MNIIEEWRNRIICGDAFWKLQELPDDSIDLIATDPQYGWSFMGKDWDKTLPRQEIYDECLRVLKPGAFMFWMSGARLDELTENGIRIRNAGFKTDFTPIFWVYATGFPKASNISKMVDKRLGAEVKTGIAFKTAGEYGNRNLKDPTPQGEARDAMRHTAQTDQSKALEGSYAGFQPKPAVEVIIVAMKPLSEKSYVDQALKNKKGVTWLDDCRIPFESNNEKEKAILMQTNPSQDIRCNSYNKQGIPNRDINVRGDYSQGRFSPNLLCEDDALNDGKVSKSTSPHPNDHATKGDGSLGSFRRERPKIITPNDWGSFSRFFSLDAWWEEKLKQLPKEVQMTFPFLIVPKASKSERNKGLEGLPLGNPPGSKRSKPAPGRNAALGKPRQNFHPTVKPLKLFSYILTLASREGDLVLDPFVGSGTTAIGCKMLNRNFIGFEINQEYVTIANARLSKEKNAKNKNDKNGEK